MTGCCGKVSGRLSDIVASLSLIIVMRATYHRQSVNFCLTRIYGFTLRANFFLRSRGPLIPSSSKPYMS